MLLAFFVYSFPNTLKEVSWSPLNYSRERIALGDTTSKVQYKDPKKVCLKQDIKDLSSSMVDKALALHAINRV